MSAMTKRGLAREIADRMGGSVERSTDFLDVLADEVAAFFARGGEEITMRGFGSFKIVRCKAYDTQCNGKAVHVKARRTITFKPAAEFRSRLN